jgi:cation transport regulator ChaB
MPISEDPTAPQRSMNSGGNKFPVPDPTILTTQQLHREILGLREILEARLIGMDKALILLQAAVDRSPSIAEIYSEFKEKFNSVQTQFKERDTRSEQSSKDSKVAVDAALQAAKEAVNEQNKSNTTAIGKSEAATTKQIDQIMELIRTMVSSFDSKISDLKERINLVQIPVNRAEGHAQGVQGVWGYIFGAIGAAIGIAALILKVSGH